MVAVRSGISKVEFAAIDTPGRHDLVDGELWSLPPTTLLLSRCITELIGALGIFARRTAIGEVFAGEMGFELDPHTVLCPDASFVRLARIPPRGTNTFFPGAPDLAVEVTSRAESSAKVQTKVARYLSSDTALIWCVYPEQRQVVVYTDDEPPRVLSEADTLDGGSVLPGFELPLRTLFA